MRIRTEGLAALVGLALSLAGSAAADEFDGSSKLICSTINVVGCDDDMGCLQGHVRSFGLPDFVVLDFDEKLIRATRESGHKETSPVKNYERRAPSSCSRASRTDTAGASPCTEKTAG